MALDDELLQRAREARQRLAGLEGEVGHARVDYHQSIRSLHAAGGSLREVAEALGLSHQRVHQIVEGEAGGAFEFGGMPRGWRLRPKRRGGGLIDRFSPNGREAVAQARAAAGELGHSRIGTGHLLLGLLDVQQGVAARALGSAGVRRERVREEVVRHAGQRAGDPVAESSIPFADGAKSALERALRVSLARGQTLIGTEHLLLSLLDEQEGPALTVLTALGVDIGRLRSQLEPPRPFG